MNILFVHQNYPGQYREILPRLAASGRHNIVFLTQRRQVPEVKTHKIVVYPVHHKAGDDAYAYSKWFENHCGAGVGAARAANQLKREGFVPDLIVGHIGWGEMLFLHDVWPGVPMLGCFEYYYIAKGGLINFDPEFPDRPDISALVHARNATTHLSHLRCAAGHTATHWQKSVFPAELQAKINVLHEGIRTELLLPDHDSDRVFTGIDPGLRRGDQIVTFVARNLEPARGFHVFMRSLPDLLTRCPKARVAIIGGDQVSYGRTLGEAGTFRKQMIEEVGDRADWSRVHFLGQVPYDQFMTLLQLSRCHVALTVPFVPSWSLLEAMALEKTIVTSDVAPVRELVRHERTGFLVDFFKPRMLAAHIADVLEHKDNYREIGRAARREIVAKYDFQTLSYPAFIAFMNKHLPRGRQIEI